MFWLLTLTQRVKIIRNKNIHKENDSINEIFLNNGRLGFELTYIS